MISVFSSFEDHIMKFSEIATANHSLTSCDVLRKCIISDYDTLAECDARVVKVLVDINGVVYASYIDRHK